MDSCPGVLIVGHNDLLHDMLTRTFERGGSAASGGEPVFPSPSRLFCCHAGLFVAKPFQVQPFAERVSSLATTTRLRAAG